MEVGRWVVGVGKVKEGEVMQIIFMWSDKDERVAGGSDCGSGATQAA